MNQEKILEILKGKNSYASGEEISHHLKISRQALWKHIQELRDIGYDIVAVPHLGYQLVSCPDKVFVSEITHGLNTKFLGRKIHYFENISSTMDRAVLLALQGECEGTLVVAETQTKGRGRLGRSWISPKHKGIYLSLILRPKILPSESPVITLLVSISIYQAIREVTGLDVKIKWPNDIVAQSEAPWVEARGFTERNTERLLKDGLSRPRMYKKLGGILTELNAETDRVHFMVVGIGLNVNNEKNSLIPGAISLKELKKENVNRVSLIQEILRRIEEDYVSFIKDGSLPAIDKWRNYNVTLGRRVKIACQNEHLEGEAVDIDSDGSLLIRNDSGLIRKITAGDVTHCR